VATHPHAELIEALHELGAVKLGNFTLKSGDTSPIYMDLRLLISEPRVLGLAAEAYAGLLPALEFDRIAAIPMAGVPIGTAVALASNRPMIFPRKQVKAYGTGRAIEGHYEEGETALVLDDLISSGGSKIEAIEPLEAAGLKVRDVIVLIDREGGGKEELASAGYALHSVLTLREIVDHLVAAGRVSAEEHQAVIEFLD
jgi:uridine monophosphate synthetase